MIEPMPRLANMSYVSLAIDGILSPHTGETQANSLVRSWTRRSQVRPKPAGSRGAPCASRLLPAAGLYAASLPSFPKLPNNRNVLTLRNHWAFPLPLYPLLGMTFDLRLVEDTTTL